MATISNWLTIHRKYCSYRKEKSVCYTIMKQTGCDSNPLSTVKIFKVFKHILLDLQGLFKPIYDSTRKGRHITWMDVQLYAFD